jgi:divalent metal cation (Fe/Co/Zn/Cd) transporter
VSVLAVSRAERDRLVRRARLLAWSGNGWHVLEFVIALGAGIAAGSVALVAFGIDSLIELAAGGVIIWRLAARRIDSERAERRAQELIAATYALLAAYVMLEATRSLLEGAHARSSWIGIGLAAVTAPTMPLLARAKRRVGHALGSQATANEGTQNMLCAYLSLALLAGLGGNAVLGWWWADPSAALVIAAVAAREASRSWRGESCSCCAPPAEDSIAGGRGARLDLRAAVLREADDRAGPAAADADEPGTACCTCDHEAVTGHPGEARTVARPHRSPT